MRRSARAIASVVPPVRRLVRQRDTAIAERDRLRAQLDAERRRGAQARADRQRLRDKVAATRQRLDDTRERLAAHRPAEIRQQYNLKYLFVVSYGRSGSTLMQGILNSIPGYTIRGENAGALLHLFEVHRQMVRFASKWKRTGVSTNAWYGLEMYDAARAYKEFRRLALITLIHPVPDSRVVGFKEIRWADLAGDGTPHLMAYVRFLRRVFPGARFVVTTRDLEEVARSRWWADTPNAIDGLRRADAQLRRLAEDLGDQAYLMHLNDYVRDPSLLRGLFVWLGEPFDAEAVAAVLARKHSS